MAPVASATSDPAIEKTRENIDDRVVRPNIDAAKSEITDQEMVKERPHTRNVFVELTHGCSEKVEQVYQKEVETQWLNEEHYLHELAKQLPP